MKNEKSRFVRSTVLFAAGAVLLYALLVCVWGDFAPEILVKNLNYQLGYYGHMFTRLQEAKQAKNVDILFVGSSRAYRGFDPRIFKKAGFDIFNLGSPAQTPIQTELLLRRYLDRLSPKTIVFEVYPESLSNDGVESSVDVISNDRNDLESVRMALKMNHVLVYNTLIYGFYRDILGKNAGFKEDVVIRRSSDRVDTYIPGGYVLRDQNKFINRAPGKTNWDLNGKQFRSFVNIVRLIKARNIRLILVQAPTVTKRYESYPRRDLFDEVMSRYAEYHNFNELIRLDDRLDFYDDVHVNQAGVRKFNKMFIEDVLGRRQLADD